MNQSQALIKILSDAGTAAVLLALAVGLYLLIVPRLQDRARWGRLQDLKSGRKPRPSAIAWIR